MIKTKSIEQKFQKLSEVEHVLKRPGRYIGSISPHTENTYVYSIAEKKMVKREVTYNPGFLKLFDEIISNSVDHSKTADGKHLDTIKVEVDRETGKIVVFDNGGIPVIKHKEYDQWVPEMIFELRAGSNFDDDDESMNTGQNGEGAALSCIFSTEFLVETCDSKNKFKMKFEENSQVRNPAKITPAEGSKGYTRITYFPDFEKLGCDFTEDNYEMLLKRVVDVAGINNHLKVYWNGERIPTRTFKDYIELYLADTEYAYDETDHWRVAISKSNDGFQHIAFVNGTNTKTGGTHINYVTSQICEQLRAYIKKKHKIDIKPSELKQHLMLFIDCSIVNPRYASQTKDDLITEVKDYKTSWTVPDRMVKKIISSSIVQSVLDWAEAKALAEEMKENRKLNKETDKANLKKIDKFSDATEKDRSKTILFLCEGDAAQGSIDGARNPKLQASYPMRGRPINVSAYPLAKVKENKEFETIRTLIGLKYGVKADVNDLNFGQICIASDADTFGSSIAGLTVNMFYRLWPEVIKSGKLYRLITPVVLVTYKKQELEFFTEGEFEVWRIQHAEEKYDYTFLKGLGSSDPSVFEKYLANPSRYMVQFIWSDTEDDEAMDLCFLKETGASDKRKVWLDLE
jgi:DNA topoisomerase-2